MLLVTHDGSFHYDEILATAILQKIYPDSKLMRTRDQSKIDTGDIVYDVGRVFSPEDRRFDHHQNTFNETFSEKYDIKMSSAGLIYKYYHEELFKLYNFTKSSFLFNIIYEKIYAEFFLSADAIDNGYDIFGSIKPRTVAEVVGGFNTYNADKDSENQKFEMALSFVSTDLNNYLSYIFNDYIVNYQYFYDELKSFSGDIYYTEKSVSMDLIFDINELLQKDLKFVVCKNQNDYRILTLRVKKDSFDIRYPLHPDWRGLSNETLDSVSKIKNCIFVHASGFTGGNKTKEGAFEMCKKSLEYINNQ